MKFIFYDEVFTPSNYQKLILCILTICESTRHHIMVLNEDGEEYQKFLCYLGDTSNLIRGIIKNDPREFILEKSIIYNVKNEKTCFDPLFIACLQPFWTNPFRPNDFSFS